MGCSKVLWSMGIAVAVCVLSQPAPLPAAIVFTGDVQPPNPASWNSSTDGYVGKTGEGSALVDAGSWLRADRLYLGYEPYGTGWVSVRGAGSECSATWINVGYWGTGELSIYGGARIQNPGAWIGANAGATGVVAVAGAGSEWRMTSDLHVGRYGSGTLSVTGGAIVSNSLGAVVGEYSGSTGTVNVDGPGSRWTSDPYVRLGYKGSGSLNISNGAAVEVSETIYVGSEPGASGTIHFGPGGGSLTTNGLWASPHQLTGTGEIYTRGLLSDLDVVFDSPQSLNQTMVLNELTDQSVTIHLDMASHPSLNRELGAGYYADGSLTIRNGIAVQSRGDAWLGYFAGSSGEATVEGAGSQWKVDYGDICVGNYGNGKLTIRDGGVVQVNETTIAAQEGSSGTVRVEGAGSQLNRMHKLHVGYRGTGTLSISDGALVSNAHGFIGYYSSATGLATVDGPGSHWESTEEFVVGQYGSATLHITGGATVSSNTSMFGKNAAVVGDSRDATGEVILDGPGSTWAGEGVVVGSRGQGTLAIRNGGRVEMSSFGTIGSKMGSSGLVTVDGAGSEWVTGSLTVAYEGQGTLTIRNGGAVISSRGHIGARTGSHGRVVLEDAGSTWTISGHLVVGGTVWAESEPAGNGELDISAGAVVVGGDARISPEHESHSTVRFGPGPASLTARTLWASPADLSGTGDIHVRGLVSDLELVFDSPESLQQTILLDQQPDQNITLYLDLSGDLETNGTLGAGYKATGSLAIRGGASVKSPFGYLACGEGSNGTAVVEGAGSQWTIGEELYVGYKGRGVLKIRDGANLTTSQTSVGSSYEGSFGEVAVLGPGSTWTSDSIIFLIRGTLNILGGGQIVAPYIAVRDSNSLTIDVSTGSRLETDSHYGWFSNAGTVRILAGPGPAPGSVHEPIRAANWKGSGSYQAIGGTWDATSHVFTVSAQVPGMSGTPVALDLSQSHRVLIDDSSSGWTLGASFPASVDPAPMSFTAEPVTGDLLYELEYELPPGHELFGAWELSAEGFVPSEDEPVYLSFHLGLEDLKTSDLALWHYDGSQWAPFETDVFTYDGQYASVLVTSFSAYAVSAVPEAGALALLLAAAFAGVV